MDAIVMLREDHKNVERLFKRMEKDDLTVVPEICEELTLHAHLEETVFYPAVRAEMEDVSDDIGESVEEHHVMKVLIGELEGMSPDNSAYKAKATVLMELVRHHVEEEETELFPEVRSQLGRSRLQELGERMAAERSVAVG